MPITTLLLDVGGVLLTNGWDRHSRELAAKTFHLDPQEIERRHNLNFDILETGKLSLDEYLHRVIFYEKRGFSRSQFLKFMHDQSKPFPQMIDLFSRLKEQYGLKIGVISNETREINAFRVKKFKLGRFVDFFVVSCFVHMRKPDEDLYRLALDIAQVPAKQALYIDDRLMYIEVAEGLGIPSLHHVDYQSTSDKLSAGTFWK